MMKTFLCVCLCQLFVATACFGSGAERHAVAVLPTPVLNTPDFAGVFGGVFGGSDRQTLRVDGCGQLRSLEFVALPGTPFVIESTVAGTNGRVYRVRTEDYPYPAKAGFYVDSRFVRLVATPPPPRVRVLPPRQEVVARLVAARGSRYVWGGNVRAGVAEMLGFFPVAPGKSLSPDDLKLWQLQGVDCSGLLYEATDGYTPRNTSTLINYGTAVPVAGLQAQDIVRRLEPLDLIVWNGHVMIVLDRERLIESRLDCTGGDGGVHVESLRPALERLLRTKVALDEYREPLPGGRKGFVIRRWYQGAEAASAGRPRRPPASSGEGPGGWTAGALSGR